MTVYPWNDVPVEQVNPKLFRQAVHGEQMTVGRFQLLAGCVVPEHQHVNEQITLLQQGRLRFAYPDGELILEAGQVLHIPSGVPHGVTALEDSLAIDVFSPPRADWQTTK